jgi:hypothetical protein
MARKGKRVIGDVTAKAPGQRPTTRRQTKSEIQKVIKQGKRYQEDVVELPTDLYENVAPEATGQKKSMREINAEASRDFKKMEKAEGDPFALKYRAGARYTPTKRDVKKGVVEDPNVFKGADAPLPRATSRQLTSASAAQRRLDAVKAIRDTGGRPKKNVVKQEEKDRATIGVISQYSGGSGLDSQRCATPGCNNNTSEITCTDCTAAGDPAGKKYTDAPHERAVQRTAVAAKSTSRNAELQNGLSQGRGAAA